jgi:hypothetical protein
LFSPTLRSLSVSETEKTGQPAMVDRSSAIWLVACLNTGAQTGSATIVISQIYGGGGNSGATLRNDFIELFNRGTIDATPSVRVGPNDHEPLKGVAGKGMKPFADFERQINAKLDELRNPEKMSARLGLPGPVANQPYNGRTCQYPRQEQGNSKRRPTPRFRDCAA